MQRFNTPRGGRGSMNNFYSPQRNQSPRGDHCTSFPTTPQNTNHNNSPHQWTNNYYHHSNNRGGSNHSFHSGRKNHHRSNDGIEAYFKPSMLENPWAKLEEKMRAEQESNT